MIVLEPIPGYLRTDFAYCRTIARQHEEAFLIPARFVSRRLRPYLWAIHAYLWTVHDLTVLPNQDEDVKLQLLDDWSRRLEQARSGQPDHPITRALAYLFEVTEMPETPLMELLIACRMDVTNQRYETFDELEEYCRFAAVPLGRMVLYLAGEVEGGIVFGGQSRQIDALWTALQLTAFWRHLGRGTRPGNPLYLPGEEMERFGVGGEMLMQRRFTPMLGSLMLHLVDRTRLFYAQGEPLCKSVAWPLRLELSNALESGLAMLERIESSGGNTLRGPPLLTQRERMACLWRAFGRASG